jgi:decaprenyl-phosphate phosphoribosyltransferase
VLAILRYAIDVDRGTAEAPEDVVLKDRVLIALGIIWVVLFGLGAVGI